MCVWVVRGEVEPHRIRVLSLEVCLIIWQNSQAVVRRQRLSVRPDAGVRWLSGCGFSGGSWIRKGCRNGNFRQHRCFILINTPQYFLSSQLPTISLSSQRGSTIFTSVWREENLYFCLSLQAQSSFYSKLALSSCQAREAACLSSLQCLSSNPHPPPLQFHECL